MQEQLRPKDEIIHQTLALLSNITNIEVQSESDIVNKLKDASTATNRNSGKTDNRQTSPSAHLLAIRGRQEELLWR